MSEADLKDEDFRAYLASSSGDEDDGDDGEGEAAQRQTVYGEGSDHRGVEAGGEAGESKKRQQSKAEKASSLRERYRCGGAQAYGSAARSARGVGRQHGVWGGAA